MPTFGQDGTTYTVIVEMSERDPSLGWGRQLSSKSSLTAGEVQEIIEVAFSVPSFTPLRLS